MQADPSAPGPKAHSSGYGTASIAFNSVQLYRMVVLALAVLVMGIAVWPKQSQTPDCAATVEIALNPPWADSQACNQLVAELSQRFLEPNSLLDSVDLAWNQWAKGQTVTQPLDRLGWAQWLASNVKIQSDKNALNDYMLVEVRVEGQNDSFIPHLINQIALSFATELDRELNRDDLYHRWEREQVQLQETLASRRQWLEQFDSTLARQASKLQLISTSPSGSTSGRTSFAFASSPSSLAGSGLPADLELLLSKILMKTEQLEQFSVELNWQIAHPERLARLDEIDQLKQQAVNELRAIGRSVRDYPILASATNAQLGVGSTTIHQNEFFPAPQQEGDTRVSETTQAIAELGTTTQDLDQLKANAASLLMDDERLMLQMATWLEGDGSPSHARVLELASLAPIQGEQAIRSSHWLILGLLSSVLAIAFGWNVSRQPDRFFTAEDVSQELSLPVFGVVVGETAPPQSFLQTLKRNERRIQWVCELILLGTVVVVLLGLLMEPRLFEVLVNHPLDGLARSMQKVFG